MGSRLPLEYAREKGANFLTRSAFDAANARVATPEPHQSVDHQRLWADLLWSPTLAFNLFGDLAANLALADRSVHTWWPDASGTVCEVRFAHSPGWLDPAYTGNLISFDAAFVLDRGDGTKGIVAVDTKYHERSKREAPKPERLPRYEEVTDRSGVFAPGAVNAVNGTDLLVMWLEHLLALSMVQHPSGEWSWVRYAVVHSSGNPDVVGACERYRAALASDSTFSVLSLEQLLSAGALPAQTASALSDRYVLSQ
jgi:hypothetical protein